MVTGRTRRGRRYVENENTGKNPVHHPPCSKIGLYTCSGLRSSSVGREIIAVFGSDYLRLYFPFGSQ